MTPQATRTPAPRPISALRCFRSVRAGRRDESGIALLLVLIALLLIAVLSLEVAQTSATQAKVGRNTMNEFLMRTAVDGRTHILRGALRYDRSRGAESDTEDEDWAWFNNETLSSWGVRSSSFEKQEGEESITFENTEVPIVAYCVDERSKLNLMGLARPADTPERRFTRRTLVRLIDIYREEWSEVDLNESDGEEMVDELMDWLGEQAEEEENPTPDVPTGRGKLLSVDDLLRVPGGKWTQQVLYDVRDPNLDPDEEAEVSDEAGDDAQFTRPNGVPGLINYLSVHAEPGANPALRINVNTCSRVLLQALFDDANDDLAEAIVEHRREGAGSEDEDATPGAGGGSEDEVGFFTNKGQMTRVDGMAESLDVYPRLNFFADVSSNVFSLHVICKVVTGTIDPDGFEDEDEGPRDLVASYQYREVVQRTEQGFVTLFTERRHDPILTDQ